MPGDAEPGAPQRAVLDHRLDHAPCGFVCFGDDGCIRLVNATLLDMLGYRREELVGRHVERILTVGSRIFYQTHWFPLLRLHGRAEEIFLMLRGAGGEDHGALVNAVAREGDGGTEYDCVVMQVRERRKYEDELLRARRVAEEARAEMEAQKQEMERANDLLEAQALELEMQQQQLREQAAELEAAGEELLARAEEAEQLRRTAEEANQAKSQFLATMSHELRTPLNAIAGYVQILELGIHGPLTDQQRESLDRIARSERHLLRLINEVLNLARIEAGHVEYEVEDTPVREIVDGVAPMVEPQMHAKGIDFAVDVPDGLAARADRDKAQQVLLNLLSNAVKFTEPGGSVRVSAAPSPGGGVRLSVRDSGVGIPAARLDSVFEPFVQVDASRTRREQGSGLGLAISRDLARGMGGDLTAESEPGRGSTFTLYLPPADSAG